MRKILIAVCAITVVSILVAKVCLAADPLTDAREGTMLTTTVVVQPHVAHAELLSTPPAAPEKINQRYLGSYGPIPRPPDRPGAAPASAWPTSPETVVGKLITSNAALSAPNDFVVQRNTSLGFAGTYGWTSSTNEPSLAESNSDVVFYAGNWYASLSLDGGQTFSYIDPNTTFPTLPRAFCDQVVQYDRSHDLFIWYVQSSTPVIAVATSADLRNGTGWKYWDIIPSNFGWPTNRWFDFPDIAIGSTYLYMSTNVFDTPSEG